jgi:hypothetical protein
MGRGSRAAPGRVQPRLRIRDEIGEAMKPVAENPLSLAVGWGPVARCLNAAGAQASDQFSSVRQQLQTSMDSRGVSFDHLVGLGEQRWWQVETECLRALQIDDQFELCRSLNGKIRRIGAFQDPIDVGASALLEFSCE